MLRRHLDIEALRALVAIADTASFSQAAGQLGRTQSAVSLQIKRLEEALGRTLLRRVQGRVDGATEEGRALIAYARQILRLNDEAYHCVARETSVGTLRVGLPEELMESVFPAAMRRFREQYPGMRLTLRCDLSAALLAAVDAGTLDLALFKHCGAAPAALDLWQEPLAWMAGEAWANERPTPLPLALFGENCAFRIAATGALAREGIEWRLAYSGSSTTGLRHAVACGLGVTVLPRSLLAPGLSVVEAGLPALPDAHLAVHHAAGETHPAAARFAALIGEEMRLRRAAPG